MRNESNPTAPRCPRCKSPMLSEPGKPRFCVRCTAQSAAKSDPEVQFKEMEAAADEFERTVKATASKRREENQRWSRSIAEGLKKLGL